MNFKIKKNYIIIGISIFAFLIGSFWIYSIASALDTSADKIAIKTLHKNTNPKRHCLMFFINLLC